MSEWTCPYCNRVQLRSPENWKAYFTRFDVGKTNWGDIGSVMKVARCLNEDCNKFSFWVSLNEAQPKPDGYFRAGKAITSWTLLPPSASRPQPELIPQALRDDYFEACSIRELSPKASATLARRCLQGMIRDFCEISKPRLIDEIKELRARVDVGDAPKGVAMEAVDAIDAVREVGNIGAHMERDIDMIVEVDPGEAQALIELIEMLFEEWYVAREKRSDRLKRVVAIAAEKSAQIADLKAEAARAAEAGAADNNISEVGTVTSTNESEPNGDID